MKLIDLTGQKFGKLNVIERAPNIGKETAWRCRCSCGNECIVVANNLKRGQKSCSISCGKTIHGMTDTSVYSTWKTMMRRCYNKKRKSFDRYGGRGIKVCERWHIFQNFFDDVSILPHFGEKGYTLDRIDNDGDYCPENCRWATVKQQNNNQRSNVKIMFCGVETTLAEVAEKTGINRFTLYDRYRHGDRGEKLFRKVEKRETGNNIKKSIG